MYRKTVLDNGIRVISEELNNVRSVSIGVWVGCGSRNEELEKNGIAHFIEHMLFKGTSRRSAFDIASEIDSVGGIINACTGKEITSYYVKIPDYHLPMAIDLLADILNNSLFDPGEIEKEKAVILQEISMVEDTPDDYIHDYFSQVFWGAHPLGWPVLGSRETVEKMDRTLIYDFFLHNYNTDSTIITAAGNLQHDELVKQVAKAFSDSRKQPRDKVEPLLAVPLIKRGIGLMEKDLEQAHAILGAPAPRYSNDLRYSAFILNAVLGGSMSSKLFQEIREKRGLAYAIHSYMVSFQDAGMFGIYFGADASKVKEIADLILAEIHGMQEVILTDKELKSAKEQIKGNFLLSMESTDNRMTRLAKNEIYFGREVYQEETLEHIDAVTSSQVRDLALSIFSPEKICFATLGSLPDQKPIRELFKRNGHPG